MSPDEVAPLLPRLVEVAEGDPGREVCGFVVREGNGPRVVVPLQNAVGAGVDPRLAAGASRAFAIDPAGHLALARRLRSEGGAIEAVFHSHVDGPARMSPADVDGSTCDGQPVLPGADQLVLGMRSGKVREVRLFSWSGFDWVGVEIPVSAAPRPPPPAP